tara:strand:- start:132 stop:1082 length:951 start_codon:yes stop_codon:yes gene_type:complete
MEIISVSGYTPNEKLQIGKRYLLQKAIKNNGLLDYVLRVKDTTMGAVIREYTKEAGVRELERMLHTIARKVAHHVVSKSVEKGKTFNVSEKQLKKYLGPKKFDKTDIENEPQVGLVNGLAWTPVGGELLHIEVVTVEGSGKTHITGKLGDVMQESVKAALSYVRSISEQLGVDAEWYTKNDIHIHVPEGATPKDGPSAGVTMVTALASAISGIKVKQSVAMTGEVTIRGRVLTIGGLKEKMLAAKQAGITEVIIPEKNKKDLQEMTDDIKDGLKIYSCSRVDEVLRLALALDNPEGFLKVVPLKVVENEQSIEVAN